MDYRRHYEMYVGYVKTLNRVRLARKHPDFVYYESHHIIPRCLGGSDDAQNLILLTPREHFLAHYLLCKIHPAGDAHFKLTNAFVAMANYGRVGIRYSNSRLFARAKEEFAHLKSNRMRGIRIQPIGYHHDEGTKVKLKAARQGRAPAKGMHHTIETRERLSASFAGKKRMWHDVAGKGCWVTDDQIPAHLQEGWRLGGKPTSEERKQQEREHHTGRTMTEEHRRKISEALKGKKKSADHIQHMKEAKSK